MGAPYYHAKSSVARFGGKLEDYLPIHEFMDSGKTAISDVRHRVLTHHMWFVINIVERIFGATITNSNNKEIAVRDICQWHISEDFNGSIPTAQDYLQNLPLETWMNNGINDAVPPSNQTLPKWKRDDKSILFPLIPINEDSSDNAGRTDFPDIRNKPPRIDGLMD